MDINAERLEIIKELNLINDISLLKAVKQLIHNGLNKEGHVNLEEYNRELDEAEAEIERGDFTTHEDLKEQMKKW